MKKIAYLALTTFIMIPNLLISMESSQQGLKKTPTKSDSLPHDPNMSIPYELACVNRDYTIFKIKDKHTKLRFMLTFNALTRLQDKKFFFELAYYNPNNAHMNDEFFRYRAQYNKCKKNGTLEQFQTQVALEQQDKLLKLRLINKSFHKINNGRLQYYSKPLRKLLEADNYLPNPIIIEHLKTIERNILTKQLTPSQESLEK